MLLTHFFEEFQTFLYNEVSLSDELFIVGDLNFHFDAPSHPGVKQIKQLLHDLGLSQFITVLSQLRLSAILLMYLFVEMTAALLTLL